MIEIAFWANYAFDCHGIWQKDPDCHGKFAVLIQDGSRQRKQFHFQSEHKKPTILCTEDIQLQK